MRLGGFGWVRCHLGATILHSNRVARYYGTNYLNIHDQYQFWYVRTGRFERQQKMKLATRITIVEIVLKLAIVLVNNNLWYFIFYGFSGIHMYILL